MKDNKEKLSAFEMLSAVLTGFSRADIQGTGLVKVYWEVVTKEVEDKVINTLFTAFGQIDIKEPNNLSPENSRAVSELMEDEVLGPFMKNLILLWYNGAWPGAEGYIVSSRAYIEGLVWRAVGAHPMGGKQPGYGSWSFPPATFSY